MTKKLRTNERSQRFSEHTKDGDLNEVKVLLTILYKDHSIHNY